MNSQTTLKILEVEYIHDYTLKLLFSDGMKKLVNFKPFLENAKHPEIKKYLYLKNFKKYNLENGDLMWGDFDLIFPIIDLYKNKIIKESRPS